MNFGFLFIFAKQRILPDPFSFRQIISLPLLSHTIIHVHCTGILVVSCMHNKFDIQMHCACMQLTHVLLSFSHNVKSHWMQEKKKGEVSTRNYNGSPMTLNMLLCCVDSLFIHFKILNLTQNSKTVWYTFHVLRIQEQNMLFNGKKYFFFVSSWKDWRTKTHIHI